MNNELLEAALAGLAERLKRLEGLVHVLSKRITELEKKQDRKG